MSLPAPSRSADTARARLLADQAIRPLNEQHARLNVLAQRLDRAVRSAVLPALAVRVRTDPRFAPLLGKLFQMALDG